MTDAANDATTGDATSQNPECTDQSPEGEGTDAAAQIASYRKRQAGAEAARKVEKDRADALAKELEAFKAANRSASDKEAADVATLTEKLRAAEERANSADQRVAAAILDAKYPNARKELPEVTDEARLAKFEAILADDVEPVTPRRPNGPQNGAGTSTEETKAETSADIEKRLRGMAVPWTV